MIHNDAERIRGALSGLAGVRSVTRGWPGSLASKNLPCIGIQKASETGADWRDDREHVTEIEYYVRIFAEKYEQLDAIAPLADAAMEGIGYSRTMTWDDGGSPVRICHIRYRKYIQADQT